jgi:hypothetical protein
MIGHRKSKYTFISHVTENHALPTYSNQIRPLRQIRPTHRPKGTPTILLMILPVGTLTRFGAIPRSFAPATGQTALFATRPTSIFHTDRIRLGNIDISVVQWCPSGCNVLPRRPRPSSRATHRHVHLLQVRHRKQGAERCPYEVWCDPLEGIWQDLGAYAHAAGTQRAPPCSQGLFTGLLLLLVLRGTVSTRRLVRPRPTPFN